jgi:hypothetical protein
MFVPLCDGFPFPFVKGESNSTLVNWIDRHEG